MGYRIEYGAQENNLSSKLSPGRTIILSVVVFCIFAFFVKILWSDGWTTLKTILFPGDLSTVKAASEDFIQAVQGGMSFSDAVTSFCAQIISDG